jgi:hypothetical protein
VDEVRKHPYKVFIQLSTGSIYREDDGAEASIYKRERMTVLTMDMD